MTYTIRRSVRFLCNFSFENLPFDEHNCMIKVLVINEDKNSVVLEKNNLRGKGPVTANTSRARTFDSENSKFYMNFDYNE